MHQKGGYENIPFLITFVLSASKKMLFTDEISSDPN
jgi:hypothetical protein